MNKILKPYTIVPSSLYVERSADRQVENIINEMGRPGYVLVSRQMGKTNLLLNARRKYASFNDKFVYVDLSNLFNDELSCFRNIIDTAIEINYDVFSSKEMEVDEFRTRYSHLPPHKQHERELRILLNGIQGKLIIVLDEIDALTKTEYSDRIFAQIRSIYFGRTNYPEFERLTYLLSGVVEPSDLIKDPKISPFNIGEKIYLNDFSKEEFFDFVRKAELENLDKDVLDRVFYWTSGNPRLTWDLFAIIEGNILECRSKEDVDTIVQQMYLTSYDKPPIDNIREIVKNNKHLQDALIEIEYGKGQIVTDQIKQDLYLAGIVNYDMGSVVIKNRIIQHSLSKKWLESLYDRSEDYLSIGIDYYHKNIYKLAIENLTKSLDQNPKKDENFVRYYLGLSHYYSNSLDLAKSELLQVNFDRKEFGKLYSSTNLYLGYISQIIGALEEAKEYYDRVLKFELKNEYYISALVNLAKVYFELAQEEEGEKILLNYLSSTIESYALEDDPDKFFNTKFIASELMAKVQSEVYNRDSQLESLEELVEKVSVRNKPIVLMSLYELTKSNEYLDQALKEILDQKLKIQKKSKLIEIKLDHDKVRSLEMYLFLERKYEDFEILIDYESKTIDDYSKEKILEKLAGFFQESDVSDEEIYSFAEYFYLYHPPVSLQIKRNLLGLLAGLGITTKIDSKRYLLELVNFLEENIKVEISIEILNLFILGINQFIAQNKLIDASELIDKIYRIKRNLSPQLQEVYLLIDYLELILLKKKSRFTDARTKASEILRLAEIDYSSKLANPILSHNLPQIMQECNATLSASNFLFKMPSTHKTSNKVGRNDIVTVRYLNSGKQVTGKFKRVEIDYNNGKCILVDN
ncbi:hypothetical protein D3C87_356620 [compost metagenome]|nr:MULTISPECIES: AAA-like domain-containing protein [Sphingobacterium]